MSKYIIERPAGMPDWVEIGIKVMVRDRPENEWIGPYVLKGYTEKTHRTQESFMVKNKNMNNEWFMYAKPYIPWTPKEGEWVRVWDKPSPFFKDFASLRVVIGQYLGCDLEGFIVCGWHWDYCARITNDDGTLIDIRCTVDELKAKTDWLGPEEN
jgi:hypothetical protein